MRTETKVDMVNGDDAAGASRRSLTTPATDAWLGLLSQPTRAHHSAGGAETHDHVAQRLFVTASYLVAGAVRDGRAPQVITRLAGLLLRLASTAFWELHYRRPASPEALLGRDRLPTEATR